MPCNHVVHFTMPLQTMAVMHKSCDTKFAPPFPAAGRKRKGIASWAGWGICCLAHAPAPTQPVPAQPANEEDALQFCSCSWGLFTSGLVLVRGWLRLGSGGSRQPALVPSARPSPSPLGTWQQEAIAQESLGFPRGLHRPHRATRSGVFGTAGPGFSRVPSLPPHLYHRWGFTSLVAGGPAKDTDRPSKRG